MRVNSRLFKDADWLIVIAVVLIMAFGLVTLYSIEHIPDSGSGVTHRSGHFFTKQFFWAVLGLVAMLLAAALPFRYYETTAYLFYALGLVLLGVVLLLPPVGGARRWIVVGTFHIQPSEFMKIAVIFALARFLAEKRSNPNRFRVLAISSLITAVPFLLIVKEPDLGTALVLPAILITVLYWRGLNENSLLFLITPIVSAFLTIYSERALSGRRYPYPLLLFFLFILFLAYRRRDQIFRSLVLVSINLGTMLLVPVFWERLKIYQQRRILAFLRPESDILHAGWQVYQSKVAIGSGGFFGKHFLHGTQKLLAFLPEKHSDFIFSVFTEEIGFLGALIILVLFAVIVIRGIYLSTRVKNRFASIAAIGISSYFAFHVCVNIGMTLGLAPVTGLPLPFMSYGGSSMLVSAFLAGVLLNFSMRFYEY